VNIRNSNISDYPNTMTSPYCPHIQNAASRMSGFPVHWMHAALFYSVFSILKVLKKLKAICQKNASIAFLRTLRNFARYALLYKWLNPKYRSMIYRTPENRFVTFFLIFSHRCSDFYCECNAVLDVVHGSVSPVLNKSLNDGN